MKAEEAYRWLLDPASRHPAKDFPFGQADLDQPGLYAWFADADARGVLADVLDAPFDELIYAGQAGASSRRSSSERVATLRTRIGGNHLHGNIESSTFRRTLTAVLLEPLGLRLSKPGRLEPASNRLVTRWMQDHLSLSTIPCLDRTDLANLEEEVLGLLDPPLNLMGMPRTPARLRLTALRRALTASAAATVDEAPSHTEPVPGGPEAHLDLLLAEELAVNPGFVAWLLALDGDAKITTLAVKINVWHEGQDCCGPKNAGENDLEVHLRINGEQVLILIEDKLWANYQPEQAERYKARADFHRARSLLVAPKVRLADPTHRQHFDIVQSVEDVAEHLGTQAAGADDELARRLRWKADRLRGLALRTRPEPRPAHHPTVTFTTFCVEWLRQHAADILANQASLRTSGQGWLWFTHPEGLIYKCIHGSVDLYVTTHGYNGTVDDLAVDIEEAGGPPGFTAASDSKGNPVLRWQGERVSPADGVPNDRAPVTLALEHCLMAARWLAQQRWATGQRRS